MLTVIGNPGNPTDPAIGQSSIIVGFDPGNGATNGYPQITAFDNGAIPQTGEVVLINGTPFSGAGLGYSTTAGNLTATDTATSRPIALEPGYALSGYSAAISHDINGNPNPPGGANSDYTAADNQHMLVAAQVSGAPD